MPKIDLFTPGAGGVNVDSNDFHIKDDEARATQNFTVDPAGTAGSMRKRDGMAKFNSSAMNGAVRGIMGLPLTDYAGKTRYIYAPFDDNGAGANTWTRSSDGTTWASVTTGAKSQQQKDLWGSTSGRGITAMKIVTLNNKIYHAGRAEALWPKINSFDGTTDKELLSLTWPDLLESAIGGAVGVTSMIAYDKTRIIVCAKYQDTSKFAVYIVDVVDLTAKQLGPETVFGAGEFPTQVIKWNGKIWIATGGSSGGDEGTVWYTRPEDSTWTKDHTFPTNHYFATGMAVFLGALYVSHEAADTTAALIEKRTPDGTWSTAYTNDSTTAGNRCGPIIVSQDGAKIYSYLWAPGGSVEVEIRSSTDGASWSNDYTPVAAATAVDGCGQPFVDPDTGNIYWAMMDQTTGSGGTAEIVENASGSYTLRASSQSLRGCFTHLRV